MNLYPADFSRNQIWNSWLVKNLPDLLAQLAYPNICLITLISCYVNLRNFGDSGFKLWIFVHNCQNFMSLCMFARFESTYNCTLVPMATPFLNHIPFCRGSSLSLYTHPRLVLTFAIVSRWTTLDLSQLMWKHGPSCTTSRRVDFLHFCGTPWGTLGTLIT
jgi:hypothetical protein